MNPTGPSAVLLDARRLLARHRRWLAALSAAVAVAATVSALSPKAPPTRAVWVAARDLSGGRPLAAAEVTLRRLPLAAVPGGALTAHDGVVGRLLAAPVRRGEPLTDVRLLEPSLLAALDRPGLVAVPVRVADCSAAAALARPGDLVDVLAVSDVRTPVVVAAGVRVLALPGRTDATGDGGGLVVVAVTTAQARGLAEASAGSRLSLALVRP